MSMWLGPVPDLHPGSIALESEDSGSVLCLRGDVDAVVVERFESQPDHAPVPVVAIDVGEMTYIDSTGLRLLVQWAQNAASTGQQAVLRRPTRRFDQVLELTGLDTLFPRRAP